MAGKARLPFPAVLYRILLHFAVHGAFQACRCVQGAQHRLQPSPRLDNVGFAYRCRSSARRRFPNRHAARKRLAISGSAHAMTAQRISAIPEGQLQPMFGGALEIPSPSPTLLIETHRLLPRASSAATAAQKCNDPWGIRIL